MQKIPILFISFLIIVISIDKTQAIGTKLSIKKNAAKPIRLRTFTPLKNLRVLAEKKYEAERKLHEEKLAEERRRKNAKVMEEQMEKSRIIQKYLNSHHIGSQSFWNDFHINRSF
jgi:predicted Holliday junction resolvase-like endonuclease